MRETRNRTAILMLVTTALCAPGVASAQQEGEPERNVKVQDRPRPDYDPIGIRAGSFFFYPSVGLQGLYDSNVLAVDDDEEDDLAAILTPRLQVKSNFSRHSWPWTSVPRPRPTWTRTTTTTRTSTPAAPASSRSRATTC
jgi:hypothetical protein